MGGALGELKLVFSDMDDTFCARDKSLPPKNMAALDVLARHGVGFVPCTGRAVSGIPAEVAAHPSVRYGIGSNGGVVADIREGVTLHRTVMSCELVSAIYERLRHLDITYDTFVRGHIFAERARFDAMDHYGIDDANLRQIRSLREPHDQEIPQLIEGFDGVEKVTIYWGDPAVRDEALGILRTYDEIGLTTSHPRNIEFMVAGTSKGSALTWLCDYLGVDTTQVVAFGDSQNDVDMLVCAGDGVAMENAGELVRATADHICPSCDDAGVGSYLLDLLA